MFPCMSLFMKYKVDLLIGDTMLKAWYGVELAVLPRNLCLAFLELQDVRPATMECDFGTGWFALLTGIFSVLVTQITNATVVSSVLSTSANILSSSCCLGLMLWCNHDTCTVVQPLTPYLIMPSCLYCQNMHRKPISVLFNLDKIKLMAIQNVDSLTRETRQSLHLKQWI